MSYNNNLAGRVRHAFRDLADVEEKERFRGVCFMVNGKMCTCVSGDDLLCRIGADKMEAALEHDYAHQMIMRGRTSKDFVYINEDGFRSQKDFDYWIKLCLEFNPIAKASKKKKD